MISIAVVSRRDTSRLIATIPQAGSILSVTSPVYSVDSLSCACVVCSGVPLKVSASYALLYSKLVWHSLGSTAAVVRGIRGTTGHSLYGLRVMMCFKEERGWLPELGTSHHNIVFAQLLTVSID